MTFSPKPQPHSHRAGPTELPKLAGESVTWEILREYIFERDQVCIGWRINHDHPCRDKWSNPHGPGDLRYMTLDHVPENGRNALGKKAPSDEWHLVAACHAFNVPGPSHDERDAERAWIAHQETSYESVKLKARLLGWPLPNS